MRAVLNRPVNVRFRLEDDGGRLISADNSTTVNVTVVDGAGAPVTTGTATRDTASGLYVYTLPAQTVYDVLTVTATATVGGVPVTLTELVRLVGRRIVSPSVLRTQPELTDLSTADFIRAQDEAEDWVISILNFSPVYTGTRGIFRMPKERGNVGIPGVYYPVSVYSISYNDVFFDSSRLATLVPRGHGFEYKTAYFGASFDPLLGLAIGGGAGFLPGVYQLHCQHGLAVPPADLQRATAALTRHIAKVSNYPDRATRIMTEQSEIWLSTPDGKQRFTGLPEVDGVLLRYRIEMPFAEDLASI